MSLTLKPNTKVSIRKPYDASMPVSLHFFEETLAQQQFADDCNINTIMERYAEDGLLDHVNRFQGSYGDFTSAVDYQTSLNQVMEAEAAFMDLPSKIRARFDNDPAQLIAFLDSRHDDDIAESVKLGLREAVTPPQAPSSQAPKAAPGGVSEPPAGGDQSPKPA